VQRTFCGGCNFGVEIVLTPFVLGRRWQIGAIFESRHSWVWKVRFFVNFYNPEDEVGGSKVWCQLSACPVSWLAPTFNMRLFGQARIEQPATLFFVIDRISKDIVKLPAYADGTIRGENKLALHGESIAP